MIRAGCAVEARLKPRGVLEGDGILSGDDGSRRLVVLDPDGNTIVIGQRTSAVK